VTSQITPERLKQVTEVYFHESCPDGTASAMICAAAFHSFGIKPKFQNIQYDTDRMDKLEPRPGQLFVDITPPKKRWEEWKAVNPIVLDHHETAKHITEGLGGVYATNHAHSGAMLAFEEVMLASLVGNEAPEGSDLPPSKLHKSLVINNWGTFAHLAMIRDTWKKDSPHWREACALAYALLFDGSLSFIEKTLEHGANSLVLPELIDLGMKIVEANERRVEKVCKTVHHETFLSRGTEYKAAFFNCTEKLISDIANELINQGADIAVGYFWIEEDGQDKVSISVRTNGKISASKIATLRGGGGHERASGFRIERGNKVSPSDIYRNISTAILDVMKE